MKGKILLAVFIVLFTSGVSFAEEILKIITWKGYAPKALIRKFEKETGIRVKITYSNNEEMIAKLRATRGAGYDVAQPSQDRISFVQKQFPVYQPIDYSKVNTDQIVPSMLAAVKKNTTVDGKSYAVPFCYGTTGLIVNKKEAPEVTDWSDLWSPKYQGKISYRLKRPMLIATAFGLGEDPFALYDDIEAYKKLMKKVEKKLIETKSYVKNYWTSGDTQVNIIKSGDANVILGWDGKGWDVHKINPNIDYIAPKSGALGWIDTFAIPSKAKNVEAAYKWINFALSAKNAAYFTNKEKYGTASKGAPEFLNEEIKADFKRSFRPEDIENIKWQPAVPAGFEAIESEVLDRIKAAK